MSKERNHRSVTLPSSCHGYMQSIWGVLYFHSVLVDWKE